MQTLPYRYCITQIRHSHPFMVTGRSMLSTVQLILIWGQNDMAFFLGALVPSDGNATANQHKCILSDYPRSVMKHFHADKSDLCHYDNDPINKWFDENENDVNHMLWALQSSHLNTIKQLWEILDHHSPLASSKHQMRECPSEFNGLVESGSRSTEDVVAAYCDDLRGFFFFSIIVVYCHFKPNSMPVNLDGVKAGLNAQFKLSNQTTTSFHTDLRNTNMITVAHLLKWC